MRRLHGEVLKITTQLARQNLDDDNNLLLIFHFSPKLMPTSMNYSESEAKRFIQ